MRNGATSPTHSVRQKPDGSLGLAYDPHIGDAFRAAPPQDVDLWRSWDAIRCPTLVLRGAESDLLRRADAEAMTERGPRAKLIELPGIGHAPALMAQDQIAAISDFLLALTRSAAAPPISRPRAFIDELRAELAAQGATESRRMAASSWRRDRRATSPGSPMSGAIRSASPIASIGDAVRQLRAHPAQLGALFPGPSPPRRAHRRASCPRSRRSRWSSATPAPTAPLGSWTLLDPGTLLAAPSCTSPFPNGEVSFVEDRQAPPSRAYLKLWEVFTLFGEQPLPGERCLDLGSSPGGWTWVLQRLGAHVISVDKAPLDPRIAALPWVEVRRESAFALDPKGIGGIDWLFSDVVCYPVAACWLWSSGGWRRALADASCAR